VTTSGGVKVDEKFVRGSSIEPTVTIAAALVPAWLTIDDGREEEREMRLSADAALKTSEEVSVRRSGADAAKRGLSCNRRGGGGDRDDRAAIVSVGWKGCGPTSRSPSVGGVGLIGAGKELGKELVVEATKVSTKPFSDRDSGDQEM